jgi:dolichol-phosphate mannosyltransferase
MSAKWSIVMPVYNEAAIIESVVDSFETLVLNRLPGSEFILVDDASTDATGTILDSLAVRHKNVRIVHQEKNGGHGCALLAGYREAKGNFIFHSDSDNQHDPSEFWKLERFAADFDVVLGVRVERQDPLVRRIITRLNRFLCHVFFRSSLQDHNSPFKVYSRTALDAVLAIINPLKPFAPSIEMALVARKLHLKIKEVPVSHWPRKTGQVSLFRWGLAKACFRTVSDLYRLKRAI